MLAAFAGSTRATVRVLHATSASPTPAAIIDVPASTGYGEPIQRLFKLKDGERVVAALSLDPRVAGDITPKKEGDAAAGARRGGDERRLRLRFGLEPFVEPSTRAGRRYARPARAPKSSASRG